MPFVVKGVNAAAQVVRKLLEAGADPDDPGRYVDDYAEGRGFTEGSKRFVRDGLLTYQKLQRDGVLRVLWRDFAKSHARPLDDEDIAEGILALMPEMRGMHGPLWVKKWLQKHATNYF